MEFGFYMNHHEKNVLPEPEFVSVFSTRPPKKHPVQSEKFTCDLCADKFKHKTTITRHISKHLKGNFFRCIDCYKHYWNEKSYIRHRFEHSDPTSPSVKCAACPKYYSDIHGLETHQTRCHTKTGSFTCKVNKCDFSTKTYNALYMHKMTHRLFSLNCPRCNQEFMSKTQLNMHRKIHSSEKNIFECTICGKGFSSHSLQITHLKENHGKKKLNSKELKTSVNYLQLP